MRKLIAILSTATALTLPFAVMAADNTSSDAQGSVQYKDNGGYTEKSSATEVNADGSKAKVEKKTDVSVDDNGLKSTDKKSETITKTANGRTLKTKKEMTAKDKANGGYKASAETANTDSKGTDVITKSTTDVSVSDDGTTTKEIKNKKTVNPPGLFNEKTSTTDTKIKTDANGNVIDQSSKTE